MPESSHMTKTQSECHHTSRVTSCRCLARVSDGAVHTLTLLIVSWLRRGAGVFCSLITLFWQWGENDNEANSVIYQRSGRIFLNCIYLSIIFYSSSLWHVFEGVLSIIFVRMIYLPSLHGICLFSYMFSFILFYNLSKFQNGCQICFWCLFLTMFCSTVSWLVS